MNYEASFDQASVIRWQEHKPKPTDLRHLQSAMFLDRPDLWPVKSKKARHSPKPLNGQIPFAFLTDPMPQCTGPHCQKKANTRAALR